MSRSLTSGAGGQPQTRAGWESKIQQQLDDIERRESTVGIQEKRLSTLQVEAEKVWDRAAKLAAREAELQALEAKYLSVLDDKEATLEFRKQVDDDTVRLTRERAQLAEEQEAFLRQCDAWNRDMDQRREELARLTAEQDAVRQAQALEAIRIAESAARSESQIEGLRSQVAVMKSAAAAALKTAEVNSAELRQRDEQLAQRERLAKELLEVDERARRNLRAAEQDLKRRLAALSVSEASAAADRALISSEAQQWEATRKRYEKELSEFEARERNLQRSTHELQLREQACRSDRAALDAIADSLLNREIAVAADEQSCVLDMEAVQRQKSLVEADREYADYQLARVAEMTRLLQTRERQVAARAAELDRWALELQWREGQFSLGASSALTVVASPVEEPLNASRKSAAVPDADTYNAAIVNIQEHHVKSLYEASVARRSSYVHVQRSSSAGHSRPASGSVYKRNVVRPASASTMTPTPQAVEFASASQLHAATNAATECAAAFTRLLGRLTALHETNDLSQALSLTRLSVVDQAHILATKAHEADALSEAQIWRTVAQSSAHSGWPPPDVQAACHARQTQIQQRRVQDLERANSSLDVAVAEAEADVAKRDQKMRPPRDRPLLALPPTPSSAVLSTAKHREAATLNGKSDTRPATAPALRTSITR